MFSVFNEARHRNMSIAIIGADCVGLDVNSLNRINRHCTVGASAAICPADDGGYVLLAGRALPYRVFRGVRWGTEKVLPQTLERFHRADIELFISNPSWDLDLPCDVIRFAQKLNSNPMFRSLKG